MVRHLVSEVTIVIVRVSNQYAFVLAEPGKPGQSSSNRGRPRPLRVITVCSRRPTNTT